jgi:hypothetical protein
MLKRFILWDFPRGGWQYDVMVGIIVGFIFLTPRDWFRDQPRVPNATGIAVLPSEHGSSVFFIDKELLPDAEAASDADAVREQQTAQATQALRSRLGSRLTVTRVKAIRTAEGELQGYMAFAHP